MKHLLACVLALTAAAAFSPTDGVAGLARLDGSFAGAHLVTASDDGCLQTTVSFNALDENRHEPGGGPTGGTS